MQPGTYNIRVSHSSYKIKQSQITVTVSATGVITGPEPAVVTGYPITGRIVSNEESMSGVNLYLREASGKQVSIDGCKPTKDALCEVQSGKDGSFTFENVPIGSYEVTAHYEGFRIDPTSQTVTVSPSANTIRSPFKVLGFAVKGSVRDETGAAVSGVAVTVTQFDAKGNKQNIYKQITDAKGEYTIEEMTGEGSYKVEGSKPRLGIQTLTNVKVSPSSPVIEPLTVTQYEVCGQLKPDASQNPQLDQRTIIFANAADASQTQSTKTNADGKFCIMLNVPKDKKEKHDYGVRVEVGKDGSRFAPKKFEFAHEPVDGIELTQSLVEMTGHVDCVET